jgi:hypothetical protein
MRFKQIVENSTTAVSVASVAKPMMTQTRENTNVRGLKPVQQVMKGAAKKKGPYSNSIVESKVTEDDLAEQDLIVIPGQGRLRRTGFIKHDLDHGEHEGHTLKNSLHTIARAASELDERLSVQSEFPEWVSEKIGAAKGMMVSVMDYLISSQEMQHDPDAMNEGSQRVDSIVTDALKVMKGPEISDAVLALKRVLGDRAYNERRGFYSFYVDQIHDMYNQQGMAEGQQFPDTSTSLAKRSISQAQKPNAPKTASGHPTVANRFHGSAAQTRVDPTITQTKVKRKDSDKPIPNFLKKEVDESMKEGKIDFAKKLQGKVDKHNKAVVKTKKDIGSRVVDIGAGGKEHNEKTDAAWDAAKKKVSEGAKR